VDPILVHSGSWQIGKRTYESERGDNTTNKNSLTFWSDSKDGSWNKYIGHQLFKMFGLQPICEYLAILPTRGRDKTFAPGLSRLFTRTNYQFCRRTFSQKAVGAYAKKFF
jgi:hypothetical protein